MCRMHLRSFAGKHTHTRAQKLRGHILGCVFIHHILGERERDLREETVYCSPAWDLWEGFLGVKITRIPYHITSLARRRESNVEVAKQVHLYGIVISLYCSVGRDQ